MSLIALIDGDKLVYTAGFGSQKKDGDNIIVQPEHFAFQKVKLMMGAILTAIGAYKYKMYITSNDRSNFRFQLAKTKGYKETRQKTKKPVHYDAVRKYLVEKWNAETIYGMEADDKLAIEQTVVYNKINKLYNNEEDLIQALYLNGSIICTEDKDLKQVPGLHYNIRKSDQFYITELEGWRNFYTQTLTGDSSDNIPGLNRVGPITAKKLLKDCRSKKEMEDLCIRQYKLKGHNMSRFNEVCSLLYLLRTTNDKWEDAVC